MTIEERSVFKTIKKETPDRFCTVCGTVIGVDAKFCTKCGTLLKPSGNSAVTEQKNTPFQTVDMKSGDSKKIETHSENVQAEGKKKVNLFAQGLPDWNIEPPQVVVRRKRKA